MQNNLPDAAPRLLLLLRGSWQEIITASSVRNYSLLSIISSTGSVKNRENYFWKQKFLVAASLTLASQWKKQTAFLRLFTVSQFALTDTMMTVYFLQTAWLMRFQFFSNTKIICCGLVINRSNSKYHYQFRERVEQETLSKQFNPLEHATAKKLHCTPHTVENTGCCYVTHNFCHNNVSDATDHPPAPLPVSDWLWLVTAHSSAQSALSAQSHHSVSHFSLWRPGCGRHAGR